MADEDGIEFKKTIIDDNGQTVYQSCSEAEWIVSLISGGFDDLYAQQHDTRHHNPRPVPDHDPPAQEPQGLPLLDASEA